MDNEELHQMRDSLRIELEEVPLYILDEIMVARKIADECYCEFTCVRCPHYDENCTCNSMIQSCLVYDIFHNLFATNLKMDEMLFLIKVLDYCMEQMLSIVEVEDYLKEEFNINVPDVTKHEFRMYGEDEEEDIVKE